ncbi:hypothetical protein B0H34DRAFT_782523 [Crassisporium funariophilum]|nr:hypothetical protein B0H34DRAFT_782523 [Crassisporium funariophilum]
MSVASTHPPTKAVNTISYAQQQLGASLTEGLAKAHAECKAKVERIAAQCRAKNRKFRDVEFDLENDGNLCLHNLMDANIFATSDVRRVPEIFEKPVFYSGTSKSAEIVQGAVEDCYLVSALSTMTSMDMLIKNLCVARDEKVGIYGFLFYRDCYWVSVIVDDLLFTRVPKYEQLSSVEKELYHYEKDKYNDTARRGADSLYFARPSTSGDTWVPIVEKAYAKLHGDYASVMYGRTCDAIEDMTGKDILDPDKFWHDELIKANHDRLFGCWFKTLPGQRSGVKNAAVDGLVGNLSHSVVRAVEIRGRRFVVLRDPWGEAGWDGAWADGSKEWTKEWLEVLPELGHTFGGKGQFVMEYKDFLTVWQEIQRTLIFDDSWVMSSQWLHVSQSFPNMSSWSFGDISFTFSLPVASPTIIVFSKINTRYFKDIQGPCIWNLDFILAKEGETEPLAESSYSFFYTRGVSVELDLEAGDYVVLARLDPAPVRDKDYFRKGLNGGWDRRKLARIMTQRAKGQSIASSTSPRHLPTPIHTLLTSDYAKASKSTTEALKTYGSVQPGESITVTTTTSTITVVSKNHSSSSAAQPRQYNGEPPELNAYGSGPGMNGGPTMEPGWAGLPPVSPMSSAPGSPRYAPMPLGGYGLPPPPPPPLPLDLGMGDGGGDGLEDDNAVVVGLRVYTAKGAPTFICGRLKKGDRR